MTKLVPGVWLAISVMFASAVSIVVPTLAGLEEDSVAAYERGDYAEAARMWRLLADQGNMAAQAALSRMYEDGLGVRQDYAEAIRFRRLAADQGFPPAQHDLGVLYFEGKGVRRDASEAAKWFRRGADQGFAWSQYNLGLMYFDGEGVPQDYVLSYQWLNLAASLLLADEEEKRDKAAKARDKVAKRMTADQIAEAQRLAREWKPKLEQP